MRLETRENISKQGAEIASVRGTLQALAESWGNDYEHVKYLQKRIADMEEKLSNVQNTLAEIEYSEQIDWLGKLNE
jgi:predicted  nucleic acid-binding Zn-ribbon protein|tara:strand:- start:1159 stop:1386 length:228 start_codon:yes stop_codon:yes gene_type:complete